MGSYTPASALGAAIIDSESANGLGFPGSNNPGNLELGDIGYGTVLAANGNQITVFPDVQSGTEAAFSQAQTMINGSANYPYGESIGDAMSTYSGGNPNAGTNVASDIPGASTATALNQIPSGSQGSAATGPPASSSILTKAGAALSFLDDPERWVALIVGLLLIGAGLISFKQTQTVIRVGGKLAAKGTELLA